VGKQQGTVEGVVMFDGSFQGKTVWLSGATGFKGSWLAEWLIELGAKVHGYSLEPNTEPSLFRQLGLASRIANEISDIRDLDAVKKSILSVQPDYVFHMAAQPLVRLSYEQPVETYATNVMGTIHVLEALRSLKKPCVAVFVTTDKCYENREWLHAYREEDPMGGYDPYSSSKGMAELAISACRRSFFKNHPVRIASARAGNVIGGGDWALDRILPDAIRALQRGEPVPVRNPNATRPWQHVLEPLGGYLQLAAAIANSTSAPADLCTAFNFGPHLESNRTVRELIEIALRHWPGSWVDRSDPSAPHEAGKLNLAVDKALHLLGWQPRWNFQSTVSRTVDWYRDVSSEKCSPIEATRRDLAAYTAGV
jgi:CDP-glucose 4,6-dehydratase